MTSVNIYRACLITCLVILSFIWPVIPWIIATLAVIAVIGLVAKNFIPPGGDRSSVHVLEFWQDVWNAFYIWKAPEEDRRSEEADK